MVLTGTIDDASLQTGVRALNTSMKSEPEKDAILGYQKNGIAIIAELLLHPSAIPDRWYRFHVKVGHVLDFPLTDSGFIRSATGRIQLMSSEVWDIEPTGGHPELVRTSPDTIIRIDAEPWWEQDERAVVFRVRVDGVVKAIFSPENIYTKLQGHSVYVPKCECPIPKNSIETPGPLAVLQVSDFVRHQCHHMTYEGGKLNQEKVLVQTGGDQAAQALCLAFSQFSGSNVAVGCLDWVIVPYYTGLLLL
jgi:hypothetical protein